MVGLLSYLEQLSMRGGDDCPQSLGYYTKHLPVSSTMAYVGFKVTLGKIEVEPFQMA